MIFFWKIDTHPPARNANNIEHYIFVTLFSGKFDTHPPLHYITLEWLLSGANDYQPNGKRNNSCICIFLPMTLKLLCCCRHLVLQKDTKSVRYNTTKNRTNFTTYLKCSFSVNYSPLITYDILRDRITGSLIKNKAYLQLKHLPFRKVN